MHTLALGYMQMPEQNFVCLPVLYNVTKFIRLKSYAHE